jgi:Flagellar hook-length control protein FliK
MAIGLLNPATDCSTAQPCSNASAEIGQTQQRPQCGAFSVLLKDVVRNIDHGPTTQLPDADDPVAPTPVTAVGDQATGPSLTGIVVVSLPQAPDIQEVTSTMADRAESLPIADANASVDQNSSPSQNPNGPAVQQLASIPLLLLNPTVAEPSDDRTPGLEPVANNPSQPKTTDTSHASLPQPVFNPNSSNEVPATQSASPTTNKPASRNGHAAPVHVGPVPLEQPSDASAPSERRPPSSPIPDQGPTPMMENHGSTDLHSTAQGNALVQSLVRPSADIRPSTIIQEQGDPGATPVSQSLAVRVIEASGGGAQGSFGDPAQGEAEGGPVQLNASGAPESALRGSQPSLFSDLSTTARQTQSPPQGIGSSVSTTAEQLKSAQAFLGEDHLATMTAPRGTAQTVQVELPSHEAGPMSVRISMMDQTVHTQFTTDRGDLGAILIGRQDQLQQSLAKSGLELGQFQVHVNQEGRQEAFPDRQSRRNGGASEQQPAAQGQSEQSHDQERPNYRSTRTLSLFA